MAITTLDGTLTIAGVIGGDDDLVKDGTGTLILSAANTYTGVTRVLQGALNLRHSLALGSTAGGTELRGGTTLILQDNITVRDDLALVGDPPGAQSPGVRIVSSGTNTVDGRMASNPLLMITTLDGTLTMAGVISGNDDLVKDGAGTLILTADNTLTGSITLLEGTLLVNGSQPNIPIIVQGGVLGGTGLLGPITLSGGRIEGAVFQASPIHPGRRDLVIGGSDGDDVIRVRQGADSDTIQVVIKQKDYHIKIRGAFEPPIDRIIVYALAGDDNVQVDEDISISAWLYGGTGDDVLRGGGGDDTLVDLSGDNIIHSRLGADTVTVGDGANQIWTDGDSDLIVAGDGDNEIHAGRGHNTILVGHGNNRIWTRDGNDSIRTGDGDNEIHAGGGNDTIITGAGVDRIEAGGGDDYVQSGAGNDVVEGDAGNDILVGGEGDDQLVGGAGRDLLIGGFGSDILNGGDADDILIAGATDHDANDAALLSIMEEWTSAASFQTRVRNLKNGTGFSGGVKLNASTVHDDSAKDFLTGDGGNDWHLYNFSGSGVKDIVFALSSQESAQRLDL